MRFVLFCLAALQLINYPGLPVLPILVDHRLGAATAHPQHRGSLG